MANPTINEKIQARFNAKRTENNLPVVDFTGYAMSLPEAYSGPQSTSNTLIYATPLAASNNLGRLKMFLNRLALSAAVGMSVQRGSATRVVQLLPQLSMELGVTLLPEDINDDQLPAGNSFTLTASSSNRLFTGSTTVALE
jgi:hypothetical protein